MKSLIIATLSAVLLVGLAGCAAHARVGSGGASVGATVYLFDRDRDQHYYHDGHGNRHYMHKGWKQ